MQRLPFDEYKRPLVRSSKCGIKFHPGCMHYNQWVRNYSELDSPNARAGLPFSGSSAGIQWKCTYKAFLSLRKQTGSS